MTKQEVRDFLAQFDQAREDFKTWPQWMQDAAVERAATFPKPPKDGVTVDRHQTFSQDTPPPSREKGEGEK
jgi:hypothetical protein